MSRTPTGRLRGAVIGSALLLQAASVEPCPADETFRIVAPDSTLAAVIDDIATRCGIDVVSSADLSAPVSIDYAQWPAGETLRRLLRRYSYRMDADADGRPTRLHIFGAAPAERLGRRDPLDAIRVELVDADAERRADAALDLLEFGDARRDEVLALLRTARSDTDAGVREAAAAVAAELDERSRD